MKTLIEYLNRENMNRMFLLEAIHEGPMHVGDIIQILHKEYNITWLTAKDYPEIGKFLQHSKVEDLDVARTLGDLYRCGVDISAGNSPKSFGLGIHYISTKKSQYGDGTLRRTLDWTDMSKDTLQNLIICLRKVLNQVDEKIEKEYIKHPKSKDLISEIEHFVHRNTPRNFYLRDIKVGVTVRELTKDDKKAGYNCIVDIEINPQNPQQRLSIGIDKNDCLRYDWQTTYGDCKEGLLTPKHLILWKDVESRIATMLNSY